LALACDQGSAVRILVLPALFDEANKLRHFALEVMRQLSQNGFDTFLPDFAGCNESTAPLHWQTIAGWQEQARAAASHFRATHVLTLRAGALLDPGNLPGFRYASLSGPSTLRALLRARVIAQREAGREANRDSLLKEGIASGLNLAGFKLGPEMIAQLNKTELPQSNAAEIAHSEVGGAGLWLRAEPDHDSAQAARLASIVQAGIVQAGTIQADIA